MSQSCANPASCPILLSSGLNTNVKFTLSEPIVCDVGVTAECNVVVLLTNSNPNKVQISPCYVKWTSSDWFTAKTVNIKALNDPNNPLLNTDMITITTAPATSPAAFYTNFNANDLLIKAANLPSSQCRATGDPHYTVGGASRVLSSFSRLVFLSPFFLNFIINIDAGRRVLALLRRQQQRHQRREPQARQDGRQPRQDHQPQPPVRLAQCPEHGPRLPGHQLRHGRPRGQRCVPSLSSLSQSLSVWCCLRN